MKSVNVPPVSTPIRRWELARGADFAIEIMKPNADSGV
jgi:hypothetical protein